MRISCMNFVRLSASFSNFDNSFLRASNCIRHTLKSSSLGIQYYRNLSILSVNTSSSKYLTTFPRYYSKENVQLELEAERKPDDGKCLDASSVTEAEDNLFDLIDYDEITGGDTDLLNKFKLLLLEVDVLRQDGLKVPSKLSTQQWKELFSMKTKSQRMKNLNYLWSLEIKKSNDKIKKERKRLAYLEKKAVENEEDEHNDHIRYGFNGNTIFLRIYDSTINLFDNVRLIRAMMLGQNVVLDCGYEKHMSIVENKLCAKQLTYLFAENRLHKEPFNIHYCNFDKNGLLYRQFLRHIPTMEDPGFPINISEQHYMELFPREKLVYLTPHCRDELRQFSHDDIYIVGALVDKQNNEPLSLAKAKSEGIRMARLPLDRYLDWSLGTKSLTLNQVVKILLDMSVTGDWNFALNHVPKRKLRAPGESVQDKKKIYNRGFIDKKVYNRGTFFQPPHHLDRKTRNFQPNHHSSPYKDENQERKLQRTSVPKKSSY